MEQWTKHKAKWLQIARDRGIKITFDLWPASHLRNLLQDPENAGMLSYWFDLPVFTSTWFAKHVELAIKDLHERYHPEDHVKVQAERVFEGLARTDLLRRDSSKTLDRVDEAYAGLLSKLKEKGNASLSKHMRVARVRDGISSLNAIRRSLHFPASNPWPVAEWRLRIRRAVESIRTLESNPAFAQYVWRGIPYTLTDSLRSLERFLDSVSIRADGCRQVLITGLTGMGKSHLLADAAESAVRNGRPVILLLGQHFGEREPWPQILSTLDLAYTQDQFLGALNCAAEAAGTRALFLIDGLNEGAGLHIWRDRLASFVSHVVSFPNLSIALSCRSEYRQHLIPEALIGAMVIVECFGFRTKEEQEEAARKYLEKRNIVRPSSPWLAPEFVNPLFLRSCCVALAAEGKTEFPRGLRGTRQTIAYYWGRSQGICTRAMRELTDYRDQSRMRSCN